MFLTDVEVAALRATIGKRAARLFCPPPSIWDAHLETSSYSIWLDSGPDFVSIFSVELERYCLRIAAERNNIPRDFSYDSRRGVIGCSDIFLNTRDPSIIRQIGVYECSGVDVGLAFEFDPGGGFSLYAGDAADEVCFFWQPTWDSFKGNLALRSIIGDAE